MKPDIPSVVCLPGLLLIVAIAAVATVAMWDRFEWFTTPLAECSRFTLVTSIVLLAPMVGAPVLSLLLEAVHLDRYSRLRRRLLPLWRDLTAACPDVVYRADGPAATNRTRYQLHRTVVEIRDCILILSRSSRRCDEAPTSRATELLELRQALMLALSWDVKMSGKPVVKDMRARRSTSNELIEECDQLGRIAAHWEPAKRLAAHISIGKPIGAADQQHAARDSTGADIATSR